LCKGIFTDGSAPVAQRGVVFFRGQTSLNKELHKELIQRLGLLSGRPIENGLYKHPLCMISHDEDPKYTPLDGERLQAMYGNAASKEKRQSMRVTWHSDITFEKNPPDFSSLRLTELPKMGGGE
jgi:alpha-ketoglutarate-dependent taurine dioxygenase